MAPFPDRAARHAPPPADTGPGGPPTADLGGEGRVHPRGRTAHGGFTLMEMLVALVVLGMVLLILSDGLRLGMAARVTAAAADGRASELEATDRALRRLIARADPGDPASPDPAFIGTAHGASFISRLPVIPESQRASRYSDVALAVDAAHRLEISWRPHYRQWIVTPPAPARLALVDGVERLDLEFWDNGSGAGGGRWVAAWRSAEPPGLVRFRIVFPPGDPRHWPDIIAATPPRPPPRS